MSDAELAAGLQEAIDFHQEILEAFRHDSATRKNGRHAQALRVLRECQARLNAKPRVKAAEPDDRFEDACEPEPVVRMPYKE